MENFEIRDDEVSRAAYSKDASIFKVRPQMVIYPRDELELSRVMEWAYGQKLPLTLRGAATGIAGGCLGDGVVIDGAKYLNKIINIDAQSATLQPGVVLDDLNRAAKPFGSKFGPETSTSNRATLGGMAANNASGSRSLTYGKTGDAILELEGFLADGTFIQFQELNEEEWNKKLKIKMHEGAIYRACQKIREDKQILAEFPTLHRRVSGYNLDELFKPKVNLARLIAGSEGTLVAISQLKVKLTQKPLFSKLLLFHFDDLKTAFKAGESILKLNPYAFEMVDKQILKPARELPKFKNKLGWINGDPEALFIIEVVGDTESLVQEKLKPFLDLEIGYAKTVPEDIETVWEVRKAGVGLLMSRKSYTNAIAFIEDIALPPEELYPFMSWLIDYLATHHKEAGIYGHIGAGCMHIRPYLNLKNESDIKLIAQIMDEVSTQLLKHHGALSGEHGDGIIRSYYNQKMFTPKVYQAFVELKNAFDPDNLLNPGKVVGGKPFQELTSQLRLNPETPSLTFTPYLDFSKEGGFELSVDLCNGNGLCRKQEGVMCPSFQATRDEYDDTRGRANALSALLHKELTDASFGNEEVKDILKLCLSCKACKTECPAHVDMAKLKMEFSYQYQKIHGTPLLTHLIGNLPTLNKFASLSPSLFNRLIETDLFKSLQKQMGISPKRTLPKIAPRRFSSLAASIKQPKGKPVVLFNDTYTEFNQPEIGLAALKVLNIMGYEAIIPPYQCCGRPLLSKGLLPKATTYAKKVLEMLSPYTDLPLIVLEPSCFSAFIDEYGDLPGCKKLKAVLFEAFIDLKLPKNGQKALIHTHCHQKALVGTSLAGLSNAGFEVEEIHAGCCGMAGSFGYEHDVLSKQIGELKLLPRIRKSTDLIVANGFSCRTQIRDFTEAQPRHAVELIAEYI